MASLGRHKPVSVEFRGSEAEIEVYRNSGSFVTNILAPELNDATVGRTIHSPSSAPHVICVGATGYRTGITNYMGEYREFDQGNDGRRSDYSSIGPTFDGRTKPDVMAPGTNIISSYSSYYLENNPEEGLIIVPGIEFFLRAEYQGDRIAARSGANQLIAFVNGVIDEVLANRLYDEWITEARQRARELGM